MKTNLLLAALTIATSIAAEPNGKDFQVNFSNCAEYVGTGPIPVARVNGFVPSRFTVANDGSGNATVVARSAKCGSVVADGSKAEAGTVTHIGVVIASPDGTGDINNYTVAYATDNERLAQRLQRGGLPAVFDADLVHEVTAEPPVPGVPSDLYVEVSPEKTAGWSFTGQVTSNVYFTTPFVANWWFESKTGVMKMSTNIPSITFLQGHANVLTRLNSDLGRLLGRNNYGQLGTRATDFDVRGEFVSGLMSVTVK